jgi:hypothetical protein
MAKANWPTCTRQTRTERVVGLCYDGNEYPAKGSGQRDAASVRRADAHCRVENEAGKRQCLQFECREDARYLRHCRGASYSSDAVLPTRVRKLRLWRRDRAVKIAG